MPEQVEAGFNSTAATFVIVAALLLLSLPRRYAWFPLFAGACYITMGQVVKVVGLNFTIIRILTLCGWIRLTCRREWKVLPFNLVDRAILYWICSSVVVYTILWQTSEAFIYQCGHAYDAIGLYFLFRSLIRDADEITTALRGIAFLLIPLAGLIALEKLTGRNMFAAFGGVPAVTLEREGVLRCQGPFPHSILAGTFAAALVPQLLSLAWQRRGGPFLAFIGVACAILITYASGSSGPLMTFAAGVFGMAFWPARLRMRLVRFGLVGFIAILQLAMKTPFWFIIAHFAVRSGSDAYYRAFLIDRAIAHFGEWWLIGTKYAVPWATKMTDITNFYVRNAIDGGLVTLLLFVTVLKRSFGSVGRVLRADRHASIREQRCFWALGASLFAHVITFLAVWYWDQNVVSWYLLLAMIGTLAAPANLMTGHPAAVTAIARPSSYSESLPAIARIEAEWSVD